MGCIDRGWDRNGGIQTHAEGELRADGKTMKRDGLTGSGLNGVGWKGQVGERYGGGAVSEVDTGWYLYEDTYTIQYKRVE